MRILLDFFVCCDLVQARVKGGPDPHETPRRARLTSVCVLKPVEFLIPYLDERRFRVLIVEAIIETLLLWSLLDLPELRIAAF